jgi:hypothetical protein
LLELQPRDAPHHESDHSEAEECESRPGEIFDMLGEASASSEPCESSFNDPSLRQDDKTLGGVGALDDVELPVSDQSDSVRGRLALVTTVSEDLPDEGKEPTGFDKNRQRSIPVLDAGGLDLTDQDHA